MKFEMTTFASGLTTPTDIAFLPDGRAVVLQKGGAIAVVAADGTVTRNAGRPPGTVDTDSEKGLLGVALDPDFANNKKLYVYVSLSQDKDGNAVAVQNRHKVQWAAIADNNSFTWGDYVIDTGLEGPANHDGGTVLVYKGQLYVSVGDTGANASPPQNKYSSCLNKANGKILRVNLDGSTPASNPLVNETMVTGCDSTGGNFVMRAPEKRVYAWGLRNPFRMWIDPKTDLLWIGDVGEGTREEISVGGLGAHFGYPFHEGTVDYSQPWNIDCTGMTPSRTCTRPVFDFAHAGGDNCVIGGLIPEGCGWPTEYTQKYFFGDHGSRLVYTVDVTADRRGVVAGSRRTFATLAGGAAAFKMGHDYSLYVVAEAANAVYKITPLNRPPMCVQNQAGMDAGVDAAPAQPDAAVDASMPPPLPPDMAGARPEASTDRRPEAASQTDGLRVDAVSGSDAPRGTDAPTSGGDARPAEGGGSGGAGGTGGSGGAAGSGGAGGSGGAAGTAGSGMGGAGRGGSSGRGGSGTGEDDAGAPRKRSSGGGCSCHVPGTPPSPAPLAPLLLIAFALTRLRRRH